MITSRSDQSCRPAFNTTHHTNTSDKDKQIYSGNDEKYKIKKYLEPCQRSSKGWKRAEKLEWFSCFLLKIAEQTQGSLICLILIMRVILTMMLMMTMMTMTLMTMMLIKSSVFSLRSVLPPLCLPGDTNVMELDEEILSPWWWWWR